MEAVAGLLSIVLLVALVISVVGVIKASRSAESGAGSYWKKALGVVFLSFFGIVVAAAMAGDGSEKSVTSVSSSREAAVAVADEPETADHTLTLPQDQSDFMAAILAAQDDYVAAPNELKKTAVRVKRDRQLRVVSPKGAIKGWYGQITELGTTGEGKAFVSIKLPEYKIYMKTWNNAFSDISDQTLIGFDTKLYNSLSEMEVGQWVKFKALLLKEGSVTEEGGISEPEFIAQFVEITSAVTDSEGHDLKVVNDIR